MTQFKFLIVLFCFTLSFGVAASDKSHLQDAYQQKAGSYPLRTKHLTATGEPIYTNRLILQNSLYLLQHAHNPVQWHAWGDFAFDLAKENGKPILLSIGYSTCHWCHVMERESFEDKEIAEFINENFVAVKVDREEHPQVDELYLTAVQKLSGSAGWPLTAILTPEGLPFFGGTYFKPNAFLDLLQRVSSTWNTRRDAVIEQAQRVKSALDAVSRKTKDIGLIDQQLIQSSFQKIATSLTAPAQGSRFPREPEMIAALRRAERNYDLSSINKVSQRLVDLADGGLHDHINGGFHRYSVDPEWRIPHFEKMLYNQSQMAMAYTHAYRLTGNKRFSQVSKSTLDFMLGTMQSPEGGFYSAMDAEGIDGEGSYYIWSYDHLSDILSKKQLALAKKLYGISPQGNFNGLNVLHYNQQIEVQEPEAVKELKARLVTARKDMPLPQIDTKLVTAWNAQAIQALLLAYDTFEDSKYLSAAKKAANRIWKGSFSSRLGLSRTLPSGSNSSVGVLEDYAGFALALLELSEITQDTIWYERSQQLANQMIERFLDEESGAFQNGSRTTNQNLIVNLITARDDAQYSGNSLSLQLLAKLFRRSGTVKYRSHARSLLSFFAKQVKTQPQLLSGMLTGAETLIEGAAGNRHHVARGKVHVIADADDNHLRLRISIKEGWHINASEVLEEDLIPTSLFPSSQDMRANCATISKPRYPLGKEVTLGFQDEPLLVYEGEVEISANIEHPTSQIGTFSGCRLVAASLKIQACSDQVCLSPEVIQIRVPRILAN